MKRTTLLLAALLHGWLLTSAGAASYTWTGAGFLGSQDFLWSNDFNWAGNVGPAPGETNVALIFPNNTAPKFTTNDLVGLSVVSIWFAGSNYVIHGKPGGNPLNLQGNPGGGWVVLATYNGSQFASTCPISLNTTGTVAVASGATLTMYSQLFGAGGFTKTSPGTLKLQAGAANLFSGLTLVTDGTLDLNNTGNAIAGPLVIGGTNLSVSPVVRLLADNQIGNSSPVRVNESGQFWLNSHDDTVGAMTLVNGAQVFTGFGSSGSLPGLLTLNGNVTNLDSDLAQVAEITGRLDLGGATRVFHADNWLRLWCAISGAGGVTKTGFGALTLADGTNNYTGATLVQQGMLHVYLGATPLGNTGTGTTVAAGAQLYVETANLGAEPLTLNGGNGVVLHFRGTNFSSGAVTLNGACVLDNGGAGDLEEPWLNLGGAIGGTGSLRKTGIGNLEFSGFGGNTFTGGLAVEEGFTFLNKSASAPALAGPLLVGRVGELNQYIVCEVLQLNQIPNNIPIKLVDYGSLSAETGAADTLGPIEMAGGLLVGSGGTFTLAGGVTNRVSTVPAAGIYGAVSLSGLVTFHCDTNSTLAVFSPLGGAGGITKTGPGEMVLSAACSYANGTDVREGTLKLEGQGRPGNGGFTTHVFPDGSVYLNGINLLNYGFYLEGGGANNGHALIYHNTNSLAGGNIEIHGGVVFKAEPTAKLTIDATITGDGGLGQVGNGTLVLESSLPNTYAGPTTFREGTLLLAHDNNVAAIPNSLTLGYPTNGAPGAAAICTAANQLAPAAGAALFFNSLTVNQNSTFDCGGFNQSVPNLNLTEATLTTGAGVLSLGGNLTVQPGSSPSSLLTGKVQLFTGAGATHTFNLGSNAQVFCTADLTESGTQNIYKDGTGQFGNLGAMTFHGTLTVHQGRWLAANSNPFGSAVGPTIVDAGASLVSFAGTFSEPLQLSGSGDAGAGALYSNSTNSFTGPITLTADATIYAESNSILSVSGVISGAGKLTKEGSGLLKLTGTDANTYTGGTVISHGQLELGKTGVNAIPGNLTTLGNGGSNGARLLLANQIADSGAMTLNGGDFLDLNNNSETIGSLTGSGNIQLGSGTLTTGGNGADTSFSGGIGGTGGLTKTGAGTMTLSANNSYTGTTAVNGGKLIVNGQQPASPVSINTGGTLGGTGRVGHISDLNGHVAPGTSPGILVCSNYSTFTPANLLQIEIAGPTLGSGYDQLQVNGTVLLMGGTLQVAMNFSGAISNQYVIIGNDGADAVSGTFTGLPEGAMLTNNGVAFQITYHGGDGNDVVLTQKSVVTGPAITSGKIVGGKFQLNATGQPGLTYTVEATSNLTSPVSWTAIGTALADGTGLIQFVDADSNLYPVRFYRLRFP